MRRQVTDSHLDINALPQEVQKDLIALGVWWAWVYELSMFQHIALFLQMAGLADRLLSAINSAGDKTQALLNLFANYEPSEEEIKRLSEGENRQFRMALFVGLWFALMRQIECVGREGCYLSDLVERGGKGEDEALLRALRIDRTIISCPTFGERVTRADIERDDAFFKNIANLLRKKWKKTAPRKKENHRDLRFMLQASDEMGVLKNLSMTQADELFIRELGVYGDGGDDPARSLQRFILRWRNNR